jgi:Polysaccharide pyruvyl transferase
VRILISEFGNKSSGDLAICIGAAKRLQAMGAEVSFLCRMNAEPEFRNAGISARHIMFPFRDRFPGVRTSEDLVDAFAHQRPELYKRLCRLLEEHDVLAVAPGGKYTEGYQNDRALVAAAVALSRGMPALVLHQSVGPIDNADDRQLIAAVFARLNVALVREERSLQWLRDAGVPEDRLVRCGDVVLAESYPAPEAPEYDLGVNVRCGFNGHVKGEVLAEFLGAYRTRRPRARVLVYSTTYDLPEHITALASELGCDAQVPMPGYPNYLRQVGRCALHVSDSWHGILFSMLSDRPVVCCQSDFRTWKLQGLAPPGDEPLEVLPGLVSSEDAAVVLDRVFAAERDPAPILGRQRRIVDYRRQKCEEAWAVVGQRLAEIKRP